MGTDETIFHESMHADNRSDLDRIRWELVQERARGRVKDAQIAELTELLDTATTPDSIPEKLTDQQLAAGLEAIRLAMTPPGGGYALLPERLDDPLAYVEAYYWEREYGEPCEIQEVIEGIAVALGIIAKP